jgi:hypothetical protein
MNANDMRKELMQKSTSLASSVRGRTGSDTPPRSMTEPPKGKSKHEPSSITNSLLTQEPKSEFPDQKIQAEPVKDVQRNIVKQLTKTFSNTSITPIKSDPDLTDHPNIPQRPPLLLSNQKYADIISHESPTHENIPLKKQPPPRPVKPLELQINSSNHSTLSRLQSLNSSNSAAANSLNNSSIHSSSMSSRDYTSLHSNSIHSSKSKISQNDNEKRPISTLSQLSDGTPFRPKVEAFLLSNLTKDIVDRYRQLFNNTDRDNQGKLNGDQVKSIWIRSGLDARTLGLVWNLSDLDDDGMLSMQEFTLGMFIIDEKLRGCSIPATLNAQDLDRFLLMFSE